MSDVKESKGREIPMELIKVEFLVTLTSAMRTEWPESLLEFVEKRPIVLQWAGSGEVYGN